jgi:ABC-type molybdenum transport system ATPase subunit/photorepair protein PhrA
LDEPLNFLDPEKRAAVEREIARQASGQNPPQFLISSHYTPDFADIRCAVFEFDGGFPISSLSSASITGGRSTEARS